MSNLGDYQAGTVIYDKFTTYRPSTGAAYTLGGTPALSVYKDNSTTQSTAGVTLNADFDGVTGLNHYTIDTSADGTFYSAGSNFQVVITTGTVDSVSVVGSVVGSFSIDKANKVDAIKVSGDATAADNAELFFDGTGYAASNSTVGTVTTLTNLPAITAGWLTATGIAADAITAAKLAADVTTELQSGLATASALATLQTTANDILVDTAVIGAAGAGLTAIPWNASWDAEVQSEVDDALVVHRLDELLNADSDIDGAAPPTVGSVFHELMTKTAGSFTYDQTTDSLEAVRDRGDAAWITATGFSTHNASDVWAVATRVLTAGTNIALAKGVGVTGFNDLDAAGVRSAVGLASANLDTQLTAIDDYLDTEVSAIKAKTDQMTFTTANRIDSQVYGMEANTVTASALASDAVTEMQSGIATAASIAALPTAAQNATAVLTTQLTEGYATDGAAPTVTQALMLIQQSITDFSISGTSLTIKKLDGSTTAATLTLNDATSPTSVTRSA